jgi:hypothetical protein
VRWRSGWAVCADAGGTAEQDERARGNRAMQQERPNSDIAAFAATGVSFAGTMMILVGAFEVINGIAAINNDTVIVRTKNYTFGLDLTAWGWIHVILGALIVLTGFALFSRKTWAVIAALALAMLSAINNFLYLPHYPFWSILVIAIDIWIIWSLTRPGVIARDD